MPGPALNDPNAPSRVQKPRLLVHVNGAVVDGALEAALEASDFYEAGRWSLDLAIVPGSPQALAWWTGQGRPLIEIFCQPMDVGSAPVLWISGEPDSIEVSLEFGTVHLEGRDLASRLIDNQTDGEALLNRTSSEIVTIIAGQVGLTPVVTATSTPIGRFDRVNHLQGLLAIHDRRGSSHALIVELAKIEGFDFYVLGAQLFFNPPASLDTAPTWLLAYQPGPPCVGNWQAGTLKLKHDLQVAKAITVTVSSWQTRSQTVLTGIKSDLPVTTAKKGVNAGTPLARGSVKFTYVKNGLTQQAADAYAARLYDQIKRHTTSFTVMLPDAFALTPQNTITLQGSGTTFDATYFIKSVSRRLSADDMAIDVSATTTSPVLTEAGSTT